MKEKMKYVKSMLFSACLVLMFCNLALSAIYSESSYYSLYQQPKTYDYTDVSGASKTQTRVGFQYQNDRTDSIVVCGKENNACVDATYNTTLTLRASYASRITAFKVYVPPGTTSVNLSSAVGNAGQYFAIARLGTPPQIDSTYVPSTSVFENLPATGFTLSELRNADCVGKNSQGYLFIAKDSGRTVATESEGGWLYVIIKVISGSVSSVNYTNGVNLGTPTTAGTFLGWHTEKTLNNTWGSLGEQSYIGTAPVTTPTPTPTGTTSPEPTPTTTPTTTGCDSFACANAGGRCVDNVCVISTPRPTPTPTSGTCNDLTCLLSGGTCVNGKCVTASTTPTPTPTTTPGAGCDPFTCANAGGSCVNNQCVINTPTPSPSPPPPPTPTPIPTPSPTPTPTSISFTAKPMSDMVVERITCDNIELTGLVPVLTANPLPNGNVTCYSALLFPGETPYLFFAQKDILQKDAFIFYNVGDTVKGHLTGAFPSDGIWKNESFQSFLSQLSGITCTSIADSGITFLFGYAPNGDISQFQGAAFTFVTTP